MEANAVHPSTTEEADADSGRLTSSYEEEEEEEGGLVLKVPPREGGERREMPRIPTLVCEEHRDDNDDDVAGGSSEAPSSRRVSRALSKQCVIDDDSHVVQPSPQSSLVVDTREGDREQPRSLWNYEERYEMEGWREVIEPSCLSSSSSLAAPPSKGTTYWTAEMTDRRRLLAAQLLSQSEGNLGNTRSFPALGSGGSGPNGKANSGNVKQLVRSHAMCADDDTRLRPPLEFARSNPSFAASKSLSRDSSATDYTDASGIDLYSFIITTLHKNEKDRKMLLEVEGQLIEFVEDKTRQSYKFNSMSSYNRMLVHRVAAFFGLDHNIDQTGTAIVVNKSDNTRLPESSFSSLIQHDSFTDLTRKILSREAQSYEEIRDSSHASHRMPMEMLSRRTRSFEVGGAAWRGEGKNDGGGETPSNHQPYALSPLAYQGGEATEEGKRRVPALAQLHKAGSFGGVPVYYRTNSNGVRPVEELRAGRKEEEDTVAPPPPSPHQRPHRRQRQERQRNRVEAVETEHVPVPSNGTTVPPDPYYTDYSHQQQYYPGMGQQRQQMMYDSYAAPAGYSGQGGGGYYQPYYPYPSPVPQYAVQPMQQQVDELTHEMAQMGGSRSSSRFTPAYVPVAPQPLMHTPYYHPMYYRYPGYEGVSYAPSPMQYGAGPVYMAPPGYIPLYQPPLQYFPVPAPPEAEEPHEGFPHS